MDDDLVSDYLQTEQRLSWQDEMEPNSSSDYQFAKISDRKYRKPPVHFSVQLEHIDGDHQKSVCHPGSIFEGRVNIKLEAPLAAQYLKLVFKGAERIHHDPIGKENKKKGERLFAIRTILWGLPEQDETSQWPIIEAGDHQFRFTCELPMVNYPPTFRHHLASCQFELIAYLERPGIRPFQTLPCYVPFEPFLISTPYKQPQLYQEKARLSDKDRVILLLRQGCHHNLLDTHSESNDSHGAEGHGGGMLSHIEVFIKRQVDVTHGSYFRSDTMVMCHLEQSAFQMHKKGQATAYSLCLPVPSRIHPSLPPIVQKNFDLMGMTTTIGFSKHVKMSYSLHVTAKVKQGLRWTKKQLFCVPLHFGTMARGEQVPSSLVSYRDTAVIEDETLHTKPRFLRIPKLDEQLPAYDAEMPPPPFVLP
ncbi:hypothetical protein EDC96DRAFT_450310 [Choanephora cucurbitarum]|nr:hypothetical protein EDC96DRAFT_450310 [Choanephora cucurbitarum]